MKTVRVILLTSVLLETLAACSHFNPKVEFPVSTEASRPQVKTNTTPTVASGSLYANDSFRPLFQDRRARHVGDVITIAINERVSSSQKSITAAQRSDNATVSTPGISGLPFGFDLKPLTGTASGSRKFNGQGETGANNTILGVIAVTVQEVLPNGNLVVSGERQLGTNSEVETIRFYGVVNPVSILGNNTVSSTQVADARIEYRGKGPIDSAMTMGWLSRFFMTVLPF